MLALVLSLLLAAPAPGPFLASVESTGSSETAAGSASPVSPAADPQLGLPDHVAELRGPYPTHWSSPHYEPGVSAGELLRRPLFVKHWRENDEGERELAFEVEVPLVEIKRFLIHGAGKTLIEAKKFEAIMKNEVALRNQSLDAFQVSDEELEKAVVKAREDFELAYPSLDFKTEVQRAFRNVELWKTHQRQTMMFDRIFLPDDPDQWPAVTTMAVIDESQGSRMFVDDAKDVYVQRVTTMQEEDRDELPDYPMMYLEILRGMVLDALHKFAQIEVFPEALPEGAVMTVDGHTIDLEEVFQWLEPHLTWKDIQEARYWMAKLTLLEEDLRSSGHLMDRETFAALWAEDEAKRLFENLRRLEEKKIPDEDPDVRAQKLADWEAAYNWELHDFQRMLFDRQMLGLQSDRFPSMWAWGEHRRLMDSYRQRIADDIDDRERLATILPHTNKITGLAKVTSEMILISALDFHTFEWREDGWRNAWERAQKVKRLLDEGADWAETIDTYSEFWDPPQPETGPQKPEFGYKFKGKWGEQTRNNLLGKTEESNYTTFLFGEPLADYAFFEQPVGAIAGPFRGPYGFYITKVMGRSPHLRPLDLDEPRHYELAQEYYLRHELNQLSRELMQTAEIVGLYGGSEQ